MITRRLTTTRAASDVTDMLKDALDVTRLDKTPVHQKPQLLSDNSPNYISRLAKTLPQKQQNEHTKDAPNHLLTQGKIKRFHRSMKNVVVHEHYYFPLELRKAITEWSNATMSAFTNHRIRSHRRMYTTGEETIIRI